MNSVDSYFYHFRLFLSEPPLGTLVNSTNRRLHLHWWNSNSFVEIRRNFSVLKHFFDLTRMQTVLAFMAVETKANILWYSTHILEQNQTIAEPPGDKHFSSILFPSTCQSVYWECLTSVFHFFFSSQPRYSFKTSIIMGGKMCLQAIRVHWKHSFTKPSTLTISLYWTI